MYWVSQTQPDSRACPGVGHGSRRLQGYLISIGSFGVNIYIVKASGLKCGRGSQIKNHCKRAGGAGTRAACGATVQGGLCKGQSAAKDGVQPPSTQCIPRWVSQCGSAEVSILEMAQSPGQTPRGRCHALALPS